MDRTMRILAVDDNSDNLVSVTALLNAYLAGCETETATSGPEGIEKARTFQPDVILLDIQMPGMDGFETCRILRQDPESGHVPVVFLTACGTDAARKIRGLECGGDAFLAKPVEPGELTAQVRAMARIKLAEDALRAERRSLQVAVADRTAALERSRALLNAIIEGTTDVIAAKDLKGRYLLMNSAGLALAGRRREEVLGSAPHSVFGPEEAGREEANDREILESGRTGTYEETVTVRGEVRTYLSTRGALRSEAGAAFGTFGISRDITARETLRKDLGESEERLRRVILDAPFPAMWHAEDGSVLLVNRAWTEIAGCSADEIPTVAAWTRFAYGTGAGAVDAHVAGLYGTGVRVDGGERKIRTKGGTVRTWHFNDAPLGPVDGKRTVLSMAADITAWRDAEEAKKESDRRFSLFMNFLPVVAFLSDEEGRVVFANQTAKDLFSGLDLEGDETGRSRTTLPALQSTEDYRAARDKGPVVREHQAADSRGRVHVLRTHRFPIRGSSEGDLIGAISLDITDEKTALRELEELNTDLEARVLERTRELETAVREVEAFSWSLSNDLLGTQRMIDGFSSRLAAHAEPLLDGEGRRLLGVVRANAIRMRRLIEDLLEFCTADRRALKLSEIDMVGMAREVFSELAAAEPEGAAGVDFRLGSLPAVHGDAGLVRQIWRQLLSNSLRFTRAKATRVIEVRGETVPGRRVYRVVDNGIGFEAKYAERIFGAFERQLEATPVPGAGVGLALVRHVVTRHGGEVRATGRPDRGAEFVFTLPA